MNMQQFTAWMIVGAILVAAPMGMADDEDAEKDEPSKTEVLQFLERNLPYAAQQLVDIAKGGDEDNDEYKERLEHWTDVVRDYREIAEHNPKGADRFLGEVKMELQCDGLSEAVAKAKTPAQKEAKRKELRATLTQVFDTRLQESMDELEGLKKDVQEIEAMIEERTKNKDEIIESRLNELTEEEEGDGDADDDGDDDVDADRDAAVARDGQFVVISGKVADGAKCVIELRVDGVPTTIKWGDLYTNNDANELSLDDFIDGARVSFTWPEDGVTDFSGLVLSSDPADVQYATEDVADLGVGNAGK